MESKEKVESPNTDRSAYNEAVEIKKIKDDLERHQRIEQLEKELATLRGNSNNVIPENKKDDWDYLYARDMEKVRGRFKNERQPGQALDVPWRSRFARPGTPVDRFHFEDGQTYEIPRGLAEHLNKAPRFPMYDFIPGIPGLVKGHSPQEKGLRVRQMVSRFSFVPLDFVEVGQTEVSRGVLAVSGLQ